MNTNNNLDLPFDPESIQKKSEEIALKQIEIEAEKLRLKDLAEIMNNFRQLTEMYTQVNSKDYNEEWYKILIEEKQKEIQKPANKTDYNPNSRKTA